MRPSLSVLMLAGLVLAPLAVAEAQEGGQGKIAPTRTYRNEGIDIKQYGTTYGNRSKQAPDRAFGLPSTGKDMLAPKQKEGPVKEADAPTGPLPQDAITPAPNGGAGVNADSFGIPDLAPNHEGIPPASPSANTDFFAHTTEFDLPKPGTDADATDTPLYTTNDPAAAGGTVVLGQDRGFGTDALARDRNFGTPDANAAQQGQGK